MKCNYLNTASDLRRIAYWMGIGNKQNLRLIKRFWREFESMPEVRKYLDTKSNPEKIFDDDNKRKLFAEEALMASIKLQNLSNNS